MKTEFNTFYWGENTKVQFEPFTEIPKDIPVTACMVMATINNEYLVLSSPERGWGLPGGHTEEGETPEETAIRELGEETAVEIDKNSLKVVGGWRITKIHKTEKNSKYPDLAYMLLFIADVKKIKQFAKKYETFDRVFLPINEVTHYAGGENFVQIFRYVIDAYKDRFIMQKDKNKVSIIIPFHNTEKYIEKCLDSIAKQTYQNIEVLLIDDGSTDNSRKICEKYVKLDKRFQIIIHKKNRGPAVARNTGLDFVTGDYICFIDSDDYVHEDFVSKLLSSGLKHKADIVECQHYCVINDKVKDKYNSEEFSKITTISSGKKVLSNYLKHDTPRISSSTLCSKIFSRAVFKKNHISFDSNLKRFEDSDIIYRLYAETKKHLFIPVKLYYHVHRKGSIMRSLEIKNDGLEDTLYGITKMLAYFSNDSVHFNDAMVYIRWNITNSIKNLSNDELAHFIEDKIINSSGKLKKTYKVNKLIREKDTIK